MAELNLGGLGAAKNMKLNKQIATEAFGKKHNYFMCIYILVQIHEGSQ